MFFTEGNHMIVKKNTCKSDIMCQIERIYPSWALLHVYLKPIHRQMVDCTCRRI